MSETAVPRLDLAPRLRRPLSPWNPFDYLVLIYWSLFFPQALRWYIDRFGHQGYRERSDRKALLETIHGDPIQSRLLIQGLLSLPLSTVGVSAALEFLGVPVSWIGVALGVALGVAGGVAFGVTIGVAEGVALGIALGVTMGVGGGVAVIVAGGIAGGVVVGVVGGVTGGVVAGVAGGVISGVSIGAALGVILGVILGVTEGLEVAFIMMAFGVSIAVSVMIFGSRLLDWFLSIPFILQSETCLGSRTTWLPLPRLQRRIRQWLRLDWDAGIFNVRQILNFSLQFIPAVRAVNAELADSADDQLLARVQSMADEPYDWKLLKYGSADLLNAMRAAAIAAVPLPRSWTHRWHSRYPTDLRFDTSARAACAGFWLWHEKDATQAVRAFERLQEIPRGQELAAIARVISSAGHIQKLSEFTPWYQDTAWLESLRLDALPMEQPRPGTLKTLVVMRSAAVEAAAANRAHAPLNRSTALARAADLLNRLLETGAETCPLPEWPLIHDAVEKWRDIVVSAGGEAGREVLREPTPNPYEGYSGLPVTGTAFAGRRDVLREIETRWSTSDPPAVILYGHRRMGKTSILRNLESGLRPGSLLVYLDMQDSANLVDHTGEVLLDFAEAIHKRATEAGMDVGSPLNEDDFEDLGRARRALNDFLTRLDPQMTDDRRLILAIDEFEYIEAGIADGRIDPGLLPYLRAINQRYRWLSLIFAGLHTLDEMGRDYRSAFFGQAEHVRVGYLRRDHAVDLITRPHPDFALEYSSQLIEELYRLTYGQPYLLQRLCWELVRRWNDRFLEEGESTPRTLEIEELEPVLDEGFYAAAEYYFDGVWSNVTEDERRLMVFMARREEPWARAELSEAGEIDVPLELLTRHDVVAEDERGVRFASELMRRWVATYRQPSS